MFTYPSVHDVGIDAMLQSHSSNGRARLRACLDNLQLELCAVKPPCGDLGGASFARHGVHDVHRAHYLNSSVVHQGGMPSRLRLTRKVQTIFTKHLACSDRAAAPELVQQEIYRALRCRHVACSPEISVGK